MQTLQRVVGLANGLKNPHVIEALFQSGITSGNQIIKMGKSKFSQTMKKHTITTSTIQEVYARAKLNKTAILKLDGVSDRFNGKKH